MKCEVGPIERTFGGSQWLVHSCTDGQTLVIYSKAGSPAAEFYFLYFLKDGEYQLYGEGTGSKVATDAARGELSVLTASDIAALIEQTKNAAKSQ